MSQGVTISSLTFRLPEDVANRLRNVAEARGLSVNKLITEICVQALAAYDTGTRFKAMASGADIPRRWPCWIGWMRKIRLFGNVSVNFRKTRTWNVQKQISINANQLAVVIDSQLCHLWITSFKVSSSLDSAVGFSAAFGHKKRRAAAFCNSPFLLLYVAEREGFEPSIQV